MLDPSRSSVSVGFLVVSALPVDLDTEKIKSSWKGLEVKTDLHKLQMLPSDCCDS